MARPVACPLQVHRTRRYSVLEVASPPIRNVVSAKGAAETTETGPSSKQGDGTRALRLPKPLALEDLLWHHSKNLTLKVQSELKEALCTYGFVLIPVRNKTAVRVIRDLRESLCNDLFPTTSCESQNCGFNKGNLSTSSSIYISEKGVPMYKLGYELCEDGVREVFRIAGGSPDDVDFGAATAAQESGCNATAAASSIRATWLRGLGLLRHVTDTALDLLQWQPPPPPTATPPIYGPLSGPNGCNAPQRPIFDKRSVLPWWNIGSSSASGNDTTIDGCHPLPDRTGDFSVLYAMHYFNETKLDGTLSSSLPDEPGVAVKAHVDPSLLVVEPFLCPTTRGLQVWDRIHETWLDCDGPESPLVQYMQSACRGSESTEVMLLFAGKGLVNALTTQGGNDDDHFEPTLHRVVTGDKPRRTVIYEQKYAPFYPPPSFD